MRTFTVAERRARLARRHHLCPEEPASGVTTLARDLVGLHATDPATVFLSAWARIPGLEPSDVEAALYDRQEVVRHLCMRRTLFVLPTDLIPTVQAACGDAVAARMRARLGKVLEAGGVTDDAARWLGEVEGAVLAVLAERGPLPGGQLSKAVPALSARITYAEGKGYGGQIGVATNVFNLLAAEGRIVRGRPTGSWASSAHRWQVLPRVWDAVPAAEARAALARHWLRAFGPAPVADLKWWTGLGLRDIRAALAGIGAVEVDLEDAGPAVALADDLEGTAPTEPWAAALPALDPTVMGWQERAWFLGPHASALFDATGNAGPTLWWDGRVVGAWVQRRDGEVVTHLLEDVGRDGRLAIESVVGRLGEWLEGTVVTPRFAAELHRRLAAGKAGA